MVETIRFLAAISLGNESAMATESPPLNPPQVSTLMVLASNFLNVPIMSIGPATPINRAMSTMTITTSPIAR